MVKTIDKANDFIKENKYKVINKYRHKYHFMSEFGWINDPNGLVEYNGVFNLYYQFNPYDSHWDTMHWGRATTTDFIKWEHDGVVMAPDVKGLDDGGGCFSGTSIIKDGLLYVFYSSVSYRQDVSLATSTDGKTFTKYKNNPIIKYPDNVDKDDFRDPFVFKENNKYYIIMGTKEKDGGTCYLYESLDLYNWAYKGRLINPKEIECLQVFECPSYIKIGDIDIITGSRQGNFDVIALFGKLDTINSTFKVTNKSLIDYGLDFYAPQFIKLKDGRLLLFSWMRMDANCLPTNDLKHGWCGEHIVPREVNMIDNKLVFLPVKELDKYKKLSKSIDKLTINSETKIYDKNSYELNFKIKRNNNTNCGFKLFSEGDNYFLCNFDQTTNTLTIDRSRSKYITDKNEDVNIKKVQILDNIEYLNFKVLVDVSSIEIFVENGKYVFSVLYYTESSNDLVFYGNNDSFENIEIYDIEI